MKTLKQRLERMKAILNDSLENRETFYDQRGDEWKASEKSDTYLEKTSKLKEVIENVEEGIELTGEYINL